MAKSNKKLNKPIDYSKKENQIGCGYCVHESVCPDRVPHINKAKNGCTKFKHFSE